MSHTAFDSTRIPRVASTRLRVAAISDDGLVRARNEDSFAAVDLAGSRMPGDGGEHLDAMGRGALLAVADGMGGHDDGDVASSMAVETLIHAMRRATRVPAGPTYLCDAVELAHRQVWAVARAKTGRRRMGTTLTAVHVRGTQAHIAQIGDSRAYVVRGGHIARLTRDQSYAEMLVEHGVLAPDEMDLSPYPNLVLQAIGQQESIDVALSTLDLRARDCLAICSDGLTDMVDDAELAATIINADRIDLACSKLVDLANTRGGHDNVTVVLAGVSGHLAAPAPDEALASTHRVIARYPYPRACAGARA